ncbi:preprotein translocase subunit YidC [Paucilactobacillus suebicus DSM 5007 = KCTC 3549]|uniref:Membrane protein insertase YidC n=2 Tax=Paucilactobacillus suebicus TaxID=152335 RepID=A0A0R1W5T7_9LACO|nr:preprotein translocase subunit YidC [Paucilactobacillus suebicus DSM 5007 = KCTC 3549]
MLSVYENELKELVNLMKNKKLSVISVLTVAALLLSGCVRTKNGKPYGMIYDYLAKPTQHLMEWISNFFGGNYGWAIIIIVFIVRMVLLPVMISQMKKSTIQQEKMSMVGPQMREIQARQKKAKTPEEQAAVSQEMMALYRENGISMTGGIGCLPLLIQMPVFAALYAAIRYSPELSSASFMGIKLGSPSILLAVLSFIAYLVQAWLSLVGLPEDQKKQMRFTMLLSPVMILFFTMSSSAGLGLYFFIGGLFAIIQTIIINMYRPRIRHNIEKELKKNPPKKIVKPTPVPVVAEETKPTGTKDSIEQLKNTTDNEQDKNTKPKKNRNQGKQHHKS